MRLEQMGSTSETPFEGEPPGLTPRLPPAAAESGAEPGVTQLVPPDGTAAGPGVVRSQTHELLSSR